MRWRRRLLSVIGWDKPIREADNAKGAQSNLITGELADQQLLHGNLDGGGSGGIGGL